MATFTNQATLTYNGNVITSNITSGEILEALSATKTAVIGTYTQDSEITYVISIVNSGSTSYSGLTITDNLGAYSFSTTTLVPLSYVNGSVRYYRDGILQADPTVTTDDYSLVINDITVPANGVATIIYVVRTNQYAPLTTASSITNTAVISGNSITSITVSETVTPESEASLTITKSICPATVTENGQVTYTFTIQNIGNTAITAGDSVSISDTFEPILKDITVTFNGAAWTSPTNYTYSETSGIFTTVLNQVTVPAATYTQNPATGAWVIEPGISTLVITGTV